MLQYQPPQPQPQQRQLEAFTTAEKRIDLIRKPLSLEALQRPRGVFTPSAVNGETDRRLVELTLLCVAFLNVFFFFLCFLILRLSFGFRVESDVWSAV